MTKMKLALLTGGLLLAMQAANAEISATITGTSDYDFRGVSLSADDPALQASIDYTHDLFYASVWGSNIDYSDDYDGDLEIDLVAGLAGETEGGWLWDVGGVYYLYPGSDSSDTLSEIEDYPELYVGGGKGIFDAKLWYSWDYGGTSEDSYYLEGNLNFSLPREFGLTLHVGDSFGDAFDEGASYVDFAVALTRSFGHFDLTLKGVTTDLGDEYESHHVFENDSRLVFSVATTFPWTKAE